MTISQSSLAAGVGASAVNTVFQASAENVPRKILVIGTPDPTLESNLTENVPEIVTNSAHAANRYGRGFGLSLLIQWLSEVFTGEIWAAPQFEDSFTQSTGNILFAGTCTVAGQLHLYIGSKKVANINIDVGDDGENVQEKVVAAMALDSDLPLTSVENGTTPEQADFTAKSGGPFGDFNLGFNYGFQEDFPAGISATVTNMSGGAGLGTIASVLAAMGVDDDQNEEHFTAIIHMYGQDTTSLDALSNWNGIGNTVTGNYGKLVARPVRSLVGDTAAGSSGLTALLTLGGNRKEADRTSGVIPVPGSPSHADEIAAKAVGIMERIAADRPEENYKGQILPSIIPGAVADRWASSYDNRDTAKKAGIGATTVDGNSVKLADVVTFYHSDDIPVANNGYREMRNISIVQNLVHSIKTNFQSTRWQGCTIVEDVTEISNLLSRQKARSLGMVLDDLLDLTDDFNGHAWIIGSYTRTKLLEGDYIALRGNSDGFDVVLPVYLTAPCNIFDIQVAFDINLSVIL